MRPISFTYAPTSTSANAICLAQQAASGASLVLNGALVSGGVATMGNQQIVTITTTENDTAVNAVITGTNRQGAAISETLALGNSALVSSTKYYYTVTSIVVSGAITANLTVGVNGLGASQAYVLDINETTFGVAVAVDTATGSPTYKLQYTYDDVFASTWPNSTTQHWFDSTSMTGKSAAFVENITAVVQAVRFVITTQASSQSLSGRIIQQSGDY